MNKLLKHLNKLTVALFLLLALFLVPLGTANAGIFDWLSGTKDADITSQNFGFLNSFLSIDEQLTFEDKLAIGNLSEAQNNSLVSIGLPAGIKTNGGAKIAPAMLREMLVAASAYSSTPDQTDDSPFITAWNTRVRDGIIAANFLPFGTKIKIPDAYGDKIFIVEDRMNRRYWHKI